MYDEQKGRRAADFHGHERPDLAIGLKTFGTALPFRSGSGGKARGDKLRLRNGKLRCPACSDKYDR